MTKQLLLSIYYLNLLCFIWNRLGNSCHCYPRLCSCRTLSHMAIQSISLLTKCILYAFQAIISVSEQNRIVGLGSLASWPEMDFNIINMMYAALPRHTQTEKTTLSCKDDCILTKNTRRWTYSLLRLQYDLCHPSWFIFVELLTVIVHDWYAIWFMICNVICNTPKLI